MLKKILIVLGIIISLFILAFIILLSLSEKPASNSNDPRIKINVQGILTKALIDYDKSETFADFNVDSNSVYAGVHPTCKKDVVLKISPDGQRIAIYAKLCKEKGYYCASTGMKDSNISSKTVDYNYVQQGNAFCQ